MWVFLLAALPIICAGGLNLTGEHVCYQEERYTENVTRSFIKNYTVREYVWCLNVPPRCSIYSIKAKHYKQVVEEEKSRQVPVCCEGYEPDTAGEACLPQCEQCVNGICDDEHKCYCHPGYRGDHCERGCEFARWGRYCRYHCTCDRGDCDPKNGHCECPAGWIGTRCEQHCPDGYFGLQCKNLCQCREEEVCNPTDGRCLSKDKFLEEISQSKIPTSRKLNPLGVSTLNIRVSSPGEKLAPKKTASVYVLTTTKSEEETPPMRLITNLKDIHVTPPGISTEKGDLNKQIITYKEIDVAEKIPNEEKNYTPTVVSIANNSHSIRTHKNKSSTTDEIIEDVRMVNPNPKSISNQEISTVIAKTGNRNSSEDIEDKVKQTTENEVNSYTNTTTETSLITETSPPSYMSAKITNKPMVVINTQKATENYDVTNEDTDILLEVMKRNVLIEKNTSGDAFRRDRGDFTRSALIGIVSTAITICLLLIGTGLYTTARIKEKRRKMNVKEVSEIPTEPNQYSFSTKSIFHFPLPDPPDYDNSIKRLDSSTTFKSYPPKTTESTYKTSIDYLELFYDQPPSRGTYRATSAPEPPSVKTEYPEVTVEPIYDEIPSGEENLSPIYANSTHEEITKF